MHPKVLVPFVAFAARMAPAAALSLTPTNPCTEDWTGPSTSNSLDGCDSSKIIDWALKNGILVAIPLVLGLLACFVACPLVFCSRYVCNCCGSSVVSPEDCCCVSPDDYSFMPEGEKARKYSTCGVGCNKAMTGILLLVMLAACLGSMYGAATLLKSIKDMVNGGFGLVDWVLALVNEFVAGIRDPVTKEMPSVFSDVETQVESVRSKVHEINEDILKSDYINLLEGVVAVLGFPAAIPFLVTIGGVVAALCSVRSCLPASLTACSFFFALLFGLGSTVMFVLDIPFAVLCNELNAQTDREKGVLQWYAVPKCNETNPFAKVQTALDDGESAAAKAGCAAMREVCTESTVYNPANEEVVFHCPDRGMACTTVANVSHFANTMTLLNPALCSVPNCTLRRCAVNCTADRARTVASDAVTNLDAAKRLIASFNKVFLPWLKCDKFFDHVVKDFPLCEVSKGLRFLGGSNLVVLLAMLVCVPVFLMGQKRFFSRAGRASFDGAEGNGLLPYTRVDEKNVVSAI